jgi:GntR family transcriptional regulator, negative regulator for fad regulon and positive regulator of fabA
VDPLSPLLRPAAHAEKSLVTAILEGAFPPGSTLPAERELAGQLGVTRPTLREVLRQLASDGWLTIQQGKPTRVNDFWRSGGLNLLSSLVRFSEELPPDFIPHLLEVRLAMAPAYTRAAVERAPQEVSACLEAAHQLDDAPQSFASFDWDIHYTLTIQSGNPIYTLILNGFSGFYEQMACLYFARVESRSASRLYYQSLHELSIRKDVDGAERLTRRVMQESIQHWRQANL